MEGRREWMDIGSFVSRYAVLVSIVQCMRVNVHGLSVASGVLYSYMYLPQLNLYLLNTSEILSQSTHLINMPLVLMTIPLNQLFELL